VNPPGPDELTWQVKIQSEEDGQVLGTGFILSDRIAMTCAHVVQDDPRCWVQPLGFRAAGCGGQARTGWTPSGDQWFDIATITLDRTFPAHARLGPLARPATGTLVDILGFPDGCGPEGQRIRARVSGDDASGRWMQLDAVDVHGGRIIPGVSGAAAVDCRSHRVVGMVVWSTRPEVATRIGWMIPLDTITEALPELKRSLPTALEADPGFTGGCDDLSRHAYSQALDRFRGLAGTHRDEPAVYYYWAIAGLAGVRPGLHAAETITAVERLLRSALWLAPGAGHVAALWALVKEDYYLRRGLHPGEPPIAGLAAAAARIDPRHAYEIVQHIPAPECHAWQSIRRRAHG
jgi:S1-C subfamily serine protease